MPTSASIRSVRLLLILFFAIASLYYISRSYSRLPIPPSADSFTPGGKEPTKPPAQFPPQHPSLHEGGGTDRSNDRSPTGKFRQKGTTKATFVTLIRNQELWDILSSIRQIEDRFNRNYHYPWVFLNDVPFTDEFKEMTTKLCSGEVTFGTPPRRTRKKKENVLISCVGLVPKEHWSIPSWIDEKKAEKAREDMESRKIIYGGSLPYRHMCRFQSGFFFRQPQLDEYDWYWRVVRSPPPLSFQPTTRGC